MLDEVGKAVARPGRGVARPSRPVWPICLLAALASCGDVDSESAARATARRDIVAIDLGARPPVIEFSGLRRDGDSIFLGPTVHGALPSSGGISVTASMADQQVLFLDSAGDVRSVVGRTGSGPGEFSRIVGLTTNGETVLAWDIANNRASVLTDERWVADLRLPGAARSEVVGLTSDGLLATTLRTALGEGPPQGERREYVFSNAEGEVVKRLLGVNEPEAAFVDVYTPDGQSAGTFALSGACSPTTHHATHGEDLLVADAAKGELFRLRRDGSLDPLFRSMYRDEVRAEYLDKVERQLDARRQTVSRSSRRTVLDRFGRAGSDFPVVWSDMVVDQAGGVWLQRQSCYATWLQEEDTVWEVLDDSFDKIAEVSVPADLSVLSVRGPQVLTLSFDELGVPKLAIYRLPD